MQPEALGRAIDEIKQKGLDKIQYFDTSACGVAVGMKLMAAMARLDGEYADARHAEIALNMAYRALWVACALSSQQAREQLDSGIYKDDDPGVEAFLQITTDLDTNFYAGQLASSFVMYLYDDAFCIRLNEGDVIESRIDFMTLAGMAMLYKSAQDVAQREHFSMVMDNVALGIELLTFAENHDLIRGLQERERLHKQENGKKGAERALAAKARKYGYESWEKLQADIVSKLNELDQVSFYGGPGKRMGDKRKKVSELSGVPRRTVAEIDRELRPSSD
ncbi:hypothetical protein [Pusillimonas sp.]|uniref:hypothetical protein n=1 Tax=Pusillimonas sp. TaxID=3040095 RepID=UPI0037C5B3C8